MTVANSWAKKANNNNYVGYIDVASQTLAINTTGSIQTLIGPSIGQLATNRIGQNIKRLRLEMRGIVYGDSLAKLNCMQFDLVYDRRPVPLQLPALTDIFTAATWEGLISVPQTNRFEVVASKTVFLNGAVANEKLDISGKPINWAFNLDLKTTFGAATDGTLSSTDFGALYLVFRGSGSAGTTDAEIQFTSRQYFQDI